MKYTQHKPCADCPFLESNAESYGIKRLSEFASGAFPCHKTSELVNDESTGLSEFHATKDSVACAGALIFCEKRNQPSQVMRIAERLGLYDHRALDMTTPVASTPLQESTMTDNCTKLPASTQIMITVTHAYQEYSGEPPAHVIAAAALRAAVDQAECDIPEHNAYAMGYKQALADIVRIANKLDPQSPTP